MFKYLISIMFLALVGCSDEEWSMYDEEDSEVTDTSSEDSDSFVNDSDSFDSEDSDSFVNDSDSFVNDSDSFEECDCPENSRPIESRYCSGDYEIRPIYLYRCVNNECVYDLIEEDHYCNNGCGIVAEEGDSNGFSYTPEFDIYGCLCDSISVTCDDATRILTKTSIFDLDIMECKTIMSYSYCDGSYVCSEEIPGQAECTFE